MIQRLDSEHPAFLAVDGPKGPRGHVHEGVGLLAKKTGAVVLALAVIPSRRWILCKSWDRLQLPTPFSTIEFYFGAHLAPEKGEKLSDFAGRVAEELKNLEVKHDPDEAGQREGSPMTQSPREKPLKLSRSLFGP